MFCRDDLKMLFCPGGPLLFEVVSYCERRLWSTLTFALMKSCYCKILRILYKDHVTNEEVRAKIQQAIGPHEDLPTIVKRRKLQWYGHVSRSSGLAKTIFARHSERGKKTRQTEERWEDNIREWTGLEFAKFQGAVGNEKNWGNWSLKHLWCPKDLRG